MIRGKFLDAVTWPDVPGLVSGAHGLVHRPRPRAAALRPRPGRERDDPGRRPGRERSGHLGRHGSARQRRNRVHADARDRRERRVHGPVAADRELQRFRRARRLPQRRGDRRSPRCGPEAARRAQARLARAAETIDVQADTPLLQTSASDLSTTVDGLVIATLPLNGRNFVSLTRTRSRGAAGRARQQHRRGGRPRLAGLRVLLGERPAPPRQQLPARRRRQQRDLAAVGGDLPERRRPRRVQAPDEHLLRRVRHARWAASSTCRSSRGPTSTGAAPSASCATTRSTRTTSSTTGPGSPGRRSASTSSAACSAARSGATGPSSSRTTRASRSDQGVNRVSTVPSAADAPGGLLGDQPGDLRPLTGRPFPGNVIPRERWDPGRREHPGPARSPSPTRPASARPTARPSTTT